MRAILLLFISIFLFNVSYSQVENSPYPIIFVHGINSSEETWNTAITGLSQVWQVSNNHNLNFVLNARGGDTTNYLDDVILPLIDINGNIVNRITKSSIYTINFKNFWNRDANNPKIIVHDNNGPGTFLTQSKSNESSIYKQGFALSILIDSVLRVTGAEKVILVGHSMGGLAIREYLQRKENGIHKWWINPSDEVNGHKVAKVLTMSTPHLGSNNVLEFFVGINPRSEAIRDLRYFYDIILQTPTPYLFSNSESNIDTSFNNKDVNCNGSASDYIDGISYGTSFSSVFPLPTNINYTWLVSEFILGTDGCVFVDKQWLYDQNGIPQPSGISDTLMTNRPHVDLDLIEGVPKDIYSIIRGLDEPDTKEFAYNISFDKLYTGFITSQSNGIELDLDFYKVTTTDSGNLVVDLYALNSGITGIAILSADGTVLISKNVTNVTESISYAGPPSNYYIRIRGYSYNNPDFTNYAFTVSSTPISSDLLVYYPFDNDYNDASGNGNNCIIEGNPTYSFVPSFLGNAMKFNGGCPDPPGKIRMPIINFIANPSFTISMWVNDSIIACDAECYFFQGNDWTPGTWIGIWHHFNNIWFGVGSPAGTTQNAVVVPFRESDRNNYVLYTMTYSNGIMRAYRNGQFLDSVSCSISYSNLYAGLGSHAFSPYTSARFIGKIDDFRIYKRALTLSEIQSLYNLAPTITLNSPNGGENFIPGTTQNITWNSNRIQNVKIELSTNNGTSWSTIISSYSSASGNYPWTIPDYNSATCKIRISDVLNSATNDVSGVFVILASISYTGLIAYYPLNNDANDYSGNNFNGTLENSPTFELGKVGNGVRILGDGFYYGNGKCVLLPGSLATNLNSRDSFTISLWVKDEGMTHFHGGSYISFGNAPLGWVAIGHYYDPDNNNQILGFSIGSPVNNNQIAIKIPFDNSYNSNFVHYSMTYNNGLVKAYINGIYAGQKNQNVNIQTTTAGLGRHWWWQDNTTYWATRLNGIIDEVRIYDYALSNGEVLSLYNNGVLPIELINFSSSVNSNIVKLQWSTSSEINNAGFDIERKSFNKEDWNKIGFVAGNGNSNEHKDFSFTDKNLSVGKYKYRLKQIDYNGNYKYYNLAEDVSIEAPNKFHVSQNYPNPFNPLTIIKYDVAKQSHVKILVYDILGREVKTLVNELLKPGRYEALFDGSMLNSGMYFYKIITKDFSDTKRMLLIK